jgi:hypothetical protein
VSLVAPDTIDVDAQIQLIDCDQQGQDAGPEADRVRQSRLNDVMIMVERERDALEAALAARLQRTTWPDGFAKLALTIVEQTPEFHIRITARPDHAIQVPSTKLEKKAIETEIATEILSAIKNRAASTQRARGRPSVMATLRPTSEASSPGRRVRSVWFHTLLWLLASVILATVYLYMKSAQG